MVDLRIREWRTLKYYDPARVLKALRAAELALAEVPMDPDVRALRTGRLKGEREARNAAIFSFGMSQHLGIPVFVSPTEAADYDFVTTYAFEGVQHFTPVQLKELVPADRNPTTSLPALLEKLKQLPPNTGTALALLLNREGRTDLPLEAFKGIPYDEMWLFWAASPDLSTWRIYGDVLASPRITDFPYPT